LGQQRLYGWFIPNVFFEYGGEERRDQYFGPQPKAWRQNGQGSKKDRTVGLHL
jgi:hypothetical protein